MLRRPDLDQHFRDTKNYQRSVYKNAMKFVGPRGVAIDVGAHIGIFTTRMLRDFEHVWAFEPDKANLECLRENAEGAHIIPLPLWSEEQAGVLKNPLPSNTGAWEFTPVKHVGEIVARTLDEYMLEPSFIKIDTQGAELNILHGAEKTLKKYSPVLIVEMNDENGVYDYLKSLGYQMKTRVNKDGIFA